MGSEMCIRDRHEANDRLADRALAAPALAHESECGTVGHGEVYTCLLYTSDAADERSSVDLGGRRIIKKKNCRDDPRRHRHHNHSRRRNDAE